MTLRYVIANLPHSVAEDPAGNTRCEFRALLWLAWLTRRHLTCWRWLSDLWKEFFFLHSCLCRYLPDLQECRPSEAVRLVATSSPCVLLHIRELSKMRGPWLKTPLLFLLVLFSSLTGTGFCEDEVDSPTPEEQEEKPPTPEDSNGDTSDPGDTTMTTSSYSVFTIMTNSSDLETGGSGSGDGEITSPVGPINSIDSDEGLGTTEILIPVVVAVVIIGVVAFVIYILYRRRKQEKNQELNKEDPYLEECSTEKVPMPMFEDDVPSVQELEIDELNQLTKKDL